MFDLTPQERQVILFLCIVVLIGTSINFALKHLPAAEAVMCFNRNLGKVELNEADKEALMSLPGIGEKLAQRIMDYRTQQGGFREPEDLKNVKGMGGAKFEKLKGLIYLK